MFKLRINAFTVNSQISGCWCKVSVLQQIDMGLPNPTEDASLNLIFEIGMTKEQIKQLTPYQNVFKWFREFSTLRESVPMRNSEDVEKIAVKLSKMVTNWESQLGGNWHGTIPFSEENVEVLLQVMGKPVKSAV